MKPLYIVGTQRDIGKTTTAIGLLHAFGQRGLKAGYSKPLGQRIQSSKGFILHDDARVVAAFLGQKECDQVGMAVPLPAGRVEKEVQHLDVQKLLQKVIDSYEALARANDVVILEAMGHVAMGSCLGLSAADIARHLGAKAILISGGGIGRAIDEISLCETFIRDRRAELTGVVMNKVWPEKYEKVRRATTRGLANLGIRCHGVIPFQAALSSPTVQQVFEHVGGEVLGGADGMHNRVHRTIVAAMEAEHMIDYIGERTLVITPGDRSDNILASLSAHVLSRDGGPAPSGIVLTGGIRPDRKVMKLISAMPVPVILVPDDTYAVAGKLRETIFKMTPEDRDRFDLAVGLVAKHVNVDGIVEALSE